jgi:tape measure domain-containing protein
VSFDIAIKIDAQVAQAVAGIKQVAGAVDQVGQQAARTATGVERLTGHLAAMGQLGAAVYILQQITQVMRAMSAEMLQVQVRAESLNMGLRFAAVGAAASEIEYLRKVTNGLGLDFQTSATAYMKFAAAARQTSLEGEGARQIFEAVAKASTVMGLSASENQGVLLALQQMISKGTVSAEELRGQLGERLPGAFQIAARAMGMTTQELGKMLEQGKLLSEDFLPKFARQLEQELGGAAEKAAERTDASLKRLGNAWEQLKQQIAGSGVASFIAGQLNILTDAFNDVSGSIQRAQRDGDGFFGQMLAGTGAIARFLAPWNAFAYQVQDAGAKLKDAEKELSLLRQGLAANPGNILLGGAIKDTERLIERLREAELLTRMLDQSAAETQRLGLSSDQSMSGAEAARLGRYTPEAAAARAKAEAEAAKRAAIEAKAASAASAAATAAKTARIREQIAAEAEQEKWRAQYFDALLKREAFDRQRYEDAEEEATKAAASAKAALDAAASDAARKVSDEWKRTTDDIERSLTDALMRGFEGGRGFIDSFVSMLKSTFATLVLQPIIRATVAPVAGALGGIFSPAAAAGQAAGGAGGMLGGLGSIGGMLGGLGFAGSMFGRGAAATMGGTGLGALLGGAGGMIGNGSVMGGLGLGLGAVAPYALAAYALYAATRHKKTPHMGSAVDIGAGGATSTLWGDGSGFTRSFSGETDAALRGLGGVSVGSLNSLAGAFGGAATFGGQARFASDGNDPSVGQFQLTRGGRSAGGVGLRPGGQLYGKDGATAFQSFAADVALATRQAVDMIGLPQWAREQFNALGSDATLEQFAALADSVAKFQTGLTGMQQAVSQLGGVFARVAGLGGDALKQLVDFAGGLEQLTQQTQGYVQNYYSRDEIAGLKAREIKDALSAVGITQDITGNDPRAQFRALVDSVDVGSEAGRKQLATLLGAADSFTGVADYLSETGGTLSGTAAGAPALGTLGNLFASGATQQVTAINAVEKAVDRVAEAVRSQQPWLGGSRGSVPPAAGWEVQTGYEMGGGA